MPQICGADTCAAVRCTRDALVLTGIVIHGSYSPSTWLIHAIPCGWAGRGEQVRGSTLVSRVPLRVSRVVQGDGHDGAADGQQPGESATGYTAAATLDGGDLRKHCDVLMYQCVSSLAGFRACCCACGGILVKVLSQPLVVTPVSYIPLLSSRLVFEYAQRSQHMFVEEYSCSYPLYRSRGRFVI